MPRRLVAASRNGATRASPTPARALAMMPGIWGIHSLNPLTMSGIHEFPNSWSYAHANGATRALSANESARPKFSENHVLSDSSPVMMPWIEFRTGSETVIRLHRSGPQRRCMAR
jgi:hypothetical protein